MTRSAAQGAPSAPEEIDLDAEIDPAQSPGVRTPSLPADWNSAWMLLLIAAVMGFLAALSIAAAVAATSLSHSWTSALEQRATVLIPETAASEEAMRRALDALRAAPGVITAEAASPEEIAALLETWLGPSPAGAAAVSAPRLIDLRLERASSAAAAEARLNGVRAALAKAGVTAELDGHGEWIERLSPAAASLRALAWTALAAIAAAAGLVVALACSSAMAAQARMIDVLRLVGALDGYIAGLFVRRFQILAFAGAALGAGLAATALSLAPVSDVPADPAALAPLLPDLRPGLAGWALMALTPFAFALIATLAARLAVEARLRRIEG